MDSYPVVDRHAANKSWHPRNSPEGFVFQRQVMHQRAHQNELAYITTGLQISVLSLIGSLEPQHL